MVHFPSQVPDKPPQIVEELRSQVDQELLKRLQEVRYHNLVHGSRSIHSFYSPFSCSKKEQYGRVCPCSISSRHQRHGMFTSTMIPFLRPVVIADQR